jgi:heptosyltransferase-3
MTLRPPDRILIIKMRYVGDVLLATPVLTRLREGFPKASLVMLVNPGTDGVVRNHPALDEVLVVERGNWFRQWRFLRTLQARRFDLVIDLTDSDRSAALSWLSRAPARVGYNSEDRWRGSLYTRIVEADRLKMHQVRYHLAATESLGLTGPAPDPLLNVSPESRSEANRLLEDIGIDANRPLVCVHPGARWWFKSWPPGRFAALADLIQRETSTQVVIVGGEQERMSAGRISETMKTPLHSLVGRTGLQELAAVLARASLMISNDNGPMHMAVALRVPVIALFGPSDPAVWGPWGEGHRTFYKGLDCRACFHPDCFRGEQNCMRQITLEEVWDAVRAAIQLRVQDTR